MHAAIPTDGKREVSYDILLAEDNRVNQKLAVRILENCGHRVEIAENGAEAVDMVKKHRYDVILVSNILTLLNDACAYDLIPRWT